MDHPIQIKWKTSQELDKQRKSKLFNDLSEHLDINLISPDKGTKLHTLTVNRKMILSLSSQDRQSSVWDIETNLEDQRFLKDEGLGKFTEFLASGILKTEQQFIWKYLALACAFKSECFVLAMMDHSIRLSQRDQNLLNTILNSQMAFLRLVKKSQINFLDWLIENNPEYFRMQSIKNYKPNIKIIILEAMAKIGKFSVTEVTQLQAIAARSSTNSEQNTKSLLRIIPWEYCEVNIIEKFRPELGEEDCLHKLKTLSFNLSQKEKQLKLKRQQFFNKLNKLKSQCEHKEKELYICNLNNVINTQKLNNPHRFGDNNQIMQIQSVPPNSHIANQPQRLQPTRKQIQSSGSYAVQKNIDRKENQTKRKYVQKTETIPNEIQSKRQTKYREKIQQPLSKNQKKNKKKRDKKNAQNINYSQKDKRTEENQSESESDREFDLAIQISKSQTSFTPPKPIATSNNVHDIEHCNADEVEKFECGHILCIRCMIGRYYNRTQAFDEINKPLSFDRASKKNVNCWVCSKILTNKDIRIINMHRPT